MIKKLILTLIGIYSISINAWWFEKIIEENKLQNRNGVMYEINQIDPFTGKAILAYKNGQKKSEINYKDGRKKGKITLWFENGQKKSEANLETGHAIGWDKDGWKKYDVYAKDLKNEKSYKKIKYHKNGKKRYEQIVENGVIKSFIHYDKNGKKKIK